MSKAARDFGIRFERELSHFLGRPTTRSQRPGIHDDAGDVIVDGVVLEAKARHLGAGNTSPKWMVWTWFRQVESKCAEDDLPALVLKRPGWTAGGSLLVVRLEDLNEIARRLA